jgi:8-amino-7-oxononanoate synthase
MPNWNDFIAQKTAQLPNRRVWRAKSCADSRYLYHDNQRWLNFTSNDYLNLNSHPALRDALLASSQRYGTGSTGAPTLSGYSKEHQLLSANLASWLGFEECLLFNSGYQLNVGIFASLVTGETQIWLAKNSHASHIDGVLLAKARFTTFQSEQISQIITRIESRLEQRHLILCEGTFSMDGTCSYLAQLIALKQRYPAQILLIIDDAHGVGAQGENGHGTLEQQGLHLSAVDLFIGTLGKTFASHGGFILGSRNMIDYLRHSVRSQIFSTMLPAPLAAVSNASLELIQSPRGQQLRRKLAHNITYFKDIASEYGLEIYNKSSNYSPIQLILTREVAMLSQIHTQLLDHQILLARIAYPTVAKNRPRLRISLTAAHTEDDIYRLVKQTVEAFHHVTS